MKKPKNRRELSHFLDLFEKAFPGGFFIGEWEDGTGFDYAASYESPTIGELIGVPVEELLAQPGRFTQLIHPEDRERALAAFTRAASTSEKVEVIYRIRHAVTGEERWILEHGASVPASQPGRRFVIGVLLDITEQRQSERALRAAEARMRMIVEGTPYLFFYTQDQNGFVTYVSPSVETITGYSVEEWIGQTHWFITDSKRNLPARRASHAHLRGEPPHGPLVIEIFHKDGRRILLEVFEHPILVNGKARGIQGVARDITDEHRLREELDEARRFEALGRLAGGIAHDFNNMLQGILLSAELAIEKEGTATADQWATSVVQLAKRGQKVVRQLLAFSQQQAFEAKPLDLRRMFMENQAVLQRMMGPAIDVRIDIPEGLPNLMADETQLLQALFNLADNARHAMPNGGRLTITARHAGDGEGARAEGGQVILEIRDSGAGIDPEHVPLVFDPFFTTRMAEGGSGLGLASVRGIVTQHGGTIRVDSEPGEGTVFTIRLPAAPAGLKEPEQPEEPAPSFSNENGGHRILLVEDHDEVRTALAQSLELGGYRVMMAADLAQAREILESQPIDVLLSDLQLPDGIGYDLATPVRERNPEAVIIFLSGFLGGLGPAADRSAPEGAVCLEKPVRFATLDAAIRSALASRQSPGGG